jgi:hypothetical protein
MKGIGGISRDMRWGCVFRGTHTEVYTLCVCVWNGWASATPSPISLILGFNWISAKAVKRIIWLIVATYIMNERYTFFKNSKRLSLTKLLIRNSTINAFRYFWDTRFLRWNDLHDIDFHYSSIGLFATSFSVELYFRCCSFRWHDFDWSVLPANLGRPVWMISSHLNSECLKFGIIMNFKNPMNHILVIMLNVKNCEMNWEVLNVN